MFSENSERALPTPLPVGGLFTSRHEKVIGLIVSPKRLTNYIRYLCCIIANPEVFDLGNARDFMTQWNNMRYQKFRQAFIEGKIPKVCRVCS